MIKLEGDWPRPGARLIWESPPGGRGRVQERVVGYEARSGQTLEVEDETISGRFGGLDPDGALRLVLDDGSIEVLRAADVFLA